MGSYDADVCIVGSGVSGALVAAALSGPSVRVLVLDAGEPPDRAEVMKRMLAGRPAYEHRRPPSRSTGRDKFDDSLLYVVGGSTWHWVGTAMRLLRADFEMKGRFGVAVDWPLRYDDLAPFYDRAEAEFGVAGDASSEPERTKGYPLPAFPRSLVDQFMVKVCEKKHLRIRATPQARNSVAYAGRAQCCSSATCHPVCPVQAKYDASHHVRLAEERGAQVLSGATATRLALGESGRIERLVFRRRDRSQHEVRAGRFVLACNAFQTARLLMLSRTERLPDGLASSSGLLGKHLMDHALVSAAGVAPRPIFPGRGPRQTSHVADYALEDGRTERSGFNLEISNKYFDPARRGRILIGRGLRGDDLHEQVQRDVQGHLNIRALLETLPDPGNRVELDPEHRDEFGDPGLRHIYDVGDYCRRGARRAQTILRSILEAGECEDIRVGDWDGRGLHIAGTARMGTDPRTSVVDRDLRAHDHDNLWIIGSSVFPTIGLTNPTLTIAALAIRLGDHLGRAGAPK
jgi:choline dehydrogenase-like flavoprotein